MRFEHWNIKVLYLKPLQTILRFDELNICQEFMNALCCKPEAFQLFIRTLSQSQPMTLMKLYLLNSIFLSLANNCSSYIHKVWINLKLFSGSINPYRLTSGICHLDFFYPFKYLLSDTLDCDYIIANVNLF